MSKQNARARKKARRGNSRFSKALSVVLTIAFLLGISSGFFINNASAAGEKDLSGFLRITDVNIYWINSSSEKMYFIQNSEPTGAPIPFWDPVCMEIEWEIPEADFNGNASAGDFFYIGLPWGVIDPQETTDPRELWDDGGAEMLATWTISDEEPLYVEITEDGAKKLYLEGWFEFWGDVVYSPTGTVTISIAGQTFEVGTEFEPTPEGDFPYNEGVPGIEENTYPRADTVMKLGSQAGTSDTVNWTIAIPGTENRGWYYSMTQEERASASPPWNPPFYREGVYLEDVLDSSQQFDPASLQLMGLIYRPREDGSLTNKGAGWIALDNKWYVYESLGVDYPIKRLYNTDHGLESENPSLLPDGETGLTSEQMSKLINGEYYDTYGPAYAFSEDLRHFVLYLGDWPSQDVKYVGQTGTPDDFAKLLALTCKLCDPTFAERFGTVGDDYYIDDDWLDSVYRADGLTEAELEMLVDVYGPDNSIGGALLYIDQITIDTQIVEYTEDGIYDNVAKYFNSDGEIDSETVSIELRDASGGIKGPDPGTAILYKKDAEGAGAPIEGAVFMLQQLVSEEWLDYTPVSGAALRGTDESGKVEFANLPPGTYRFVEAAAAEGFTPGSAVYDHEDFLIGEGDTVGRVINCTNARIAPGEFSAEIKGLKAVAGADAPARTFEFSLTQVKNALGEAFDGSPITQAKRVSTAAGPGEYPVSFDPISLSEGTYYFKVVESFDSAYGWYYDKNSYIVIVAVDAQGAGEIYYPQSGDVTLEKDIVIATTNFPNLQAWENSYKLIEPGDGYGFPYWTLCSDKWLGLPSGTDNTTIFDNLDSIGQTRDHTQSALAYCLSDRTIGWGWPSYWDPYLSDDDLSLLLGFEVPDRAMFAEFLLWYFEFRANYPEGNWDPSDWSQWPEALPAIPGLFAERNYLDSGETIADKLYKEMIQDGTDEPPVATLEQFTATVRAIDRMIDAYNPNIDPYQTVDPELSCITSIDMIYEPESETSGWLSFAYEGFIPPAHDLTFSWEIKAAMNASIKDADGNLLNPGNGDGSIPTRITDKFYIQHDGTGSVKFTLSDAMAYLVNGSLMGDLFRDMSGGYNSYYDDQTYVGRQRMLTAYAQFSPIQSALTIGKGDKVTLKNRYAIQEPGSLKLIKDVANSDWDEGEEFEFSVAFANDWGLYSDIISDNASFIKGDGGRTWSGPLTKGRDSVTFTGVPVGTSYAITEADYTDDGYAAAVTRGSAGGGIVYAWQTDGVTFTNTYTAPDASEPPTQETGSLTVNKAWAGTNPDGHPASVEVQLYKDGAPEGDPVTLDEGNSWSHTWGSLDEEAAWTVDELNVPEGYTSIGAIKGEGDIYTITNTFVTPQETGRLIVHKAWAGANPSGHPVSVQVQLYKNGAAEGPPVTLTAADNDWTYTWSNLDGRYTWTVDEPVIPTGYREVIAEPGANVYTITNTYIPPSRPPADTPSDTPTPPAEPPSNPPAEPPDDRLPDDRPPADSPPANPPPVQPGGRDSDQPPVPHAPGRNVEPVVGEDGIIRTYIEFDDNGVPLGEWHWDEPDNMWIFDEYPPLGSLPQTGAAGIPFALLLPPGLALAGLGVTLRRKMGKGGRHAE